MNQRLARTTDTSQETAQSRASPEFEGYLESGLLVGGSDSANDK